MLWIVKSLIACGLVSGRVNADVCNESQLGRRIEAGLGRPGLKWCLVDDDFQVVQTRRERYAAAVVTVPNSRR